MQQAAACSNTRVRRPYYVWEPKSNQLTALLGRQLEEQNTKARKEVERQLKAAEVKGTKEYEYLLEKQRERDAYNY